ncbi:MAG: hypothetical protein M1828_006173 [Chrysothrix sp. TS-e1954]|nr:MAG: hypothetical protein M1828_006173 [Chrysothrix sp. TS-e1954]
MAKTHDKKSKVAAAPAQNGVKQGKMAKPVADPLPKVSSKKTKKPRSPTPESDSESADSSGSGSDVESKSDSGNDSDISSASEKAAPPKVNGSKKVTNGAAKPAESDDSSDDSASGSDVESEDEKPASKKAAPSAVGKAVKATKAESSSEGSDDESDSGSDESDASPAKAGTTPKAAVVNGADAAGKSDEDSASGTSEGTSSEGSEDESEDEAPAPKKRKADDAAATVSDAKKVKKADGAADVPAGTSKNLFVGSLSWNVDTEWLRREFEDFGDIADVRVITDRETQRSKGYAYVEFVNAADAAKALEEKNGSELDGRAMNVDFAKAREERTPNDRGNQRAKQFGDSKSPPSDTLWVGNISFGATAEMMQDLFGDFGSVTSVRLPTDRESGALKGFGYVGFSSVEEAQAAIESNGTLSLEGRPLRMDFAGPRPDNGGGGRGGFGGGFGGGRGGRGDFRGGRGGRGGRGDFRGGRGGDRGGRGRGGFRGNSTNRGGMRDFSGQKTAL